MKIWRMTLFTTYILGLISRMTARPVVSGGKASYKNNLIFAAAACAALVLVAGLRNNIGDTPAYVDGFKQLPLNFQSAWSDVIVSGTGKDKGFSFLSMLIKSFISDDPQMLLFICSLLTITMIFICFYRTTEFLDLAIFLFITTGCYLVTMNGVRQYLASAALFLAFPWIHQKKWYLYLPLVLIVSTLHESALLFLPLYFIADKPAWGKTTKLILCAGAVLYITYPVSGPMIANLLSESQYGDYSDMLMSQDAGANMLRVAVMAVPVVLSYLGRDMMEGKEKYYNIIVNMSVINLLAILLATRFWIYARFNMYFSLYMILLLIWCVIYLFDEKNRKIVYLFCLGFYGVYYWYEIAISLGQTYASNYIKL